MKFWTSRRTRQTPKRCAAHVLRSILDSDDSGGEWAAVGYHSRCHTGDAPSRPCSCAHMGNHTTQRSSHALIRSGIQLKQFAEERVDRGYLNQRPRSMAPPNSNAVSAPAASTNLVLRALCCSSSGNSLPPSGRSSGRTLETTRKRIHSNSGCERELRRMSAMC